MLPFLWRAEEVDGKMFGWNIYAKIQYNPAEWKIIEGKTMVIMMS